jgi:flagellar biosynthesis protein
VIVDDSNGDKELKKVVGLSYDKGHGLPKVVLKGAGFFADDILKKGRSLKQKPLVVKNKDLVNQLYKMPIDTDIGPDLFELVASVLVHLYSIDDIYEER